MPRSSPPLIQPVISNLDLALLRTFVAVVDKGGIARAADFIGRSQPATSLQLKRLEDTTGSPLLRKSGRGVTLTENGEILLGYARRLLELNDETVSALTQSRLSGPVRLGISQDFGEGWLTGVLARFARMFPSVTLEIKASRNGNLFDAISKRRLDLALMFGEKKAGAIDLGTVPMVWIGPHAGVQSAAGKTPLVAFEPPCEFRRVAIEVLDNAKMPWRIAFSSSNLSSQWSAVEAGLGIALRTPIGIRSGLVILGEKSGLPTLPQSTLRVLLHSADGGLSAPALKLREIVNQTVRERLAADVKGMRRETRPVGL